MDGRNPFFFYSGDLEKYINEVGKSKKHFILLINKADYLSEELIAHWNNYFKEKGINHIFFSALKEQEALDAGPDIDMPIEEEEEKKEESDEDDEDDEDGEDDDEDEKEEDMKVDGIDRDAVETTGAFTREYEKKMREEQAKGEGPYAQTH